MTFCHEKKHVRWKNNAVLMVIKTALDRIPCYKRTALKEECLYVLWLEFLEKVLSQNSNNLLLIDIVRAWKLCNTEVSEGILGLSYFKVNLECWKNLTSNLPVCTIFRILLMTLVAWLTRPKLFELLRSGPSKVAQSICMVSSQLHSEQYHEKNA